MRKTDNNDVSKDFPIQKSNGINTVQIRKKLQIEAFGSRRWTTEIKKKSVEFDLMLLF